MVGIDLGASSRSDKANRASRPKRRGKRRVDYASDDGCALYEGRLDVQIIN
jgi:hypothetical protein